MTAIDTTIDPITPQEAADLRRRLDRLAPVPSGIPDAPPPPDPSSWAGQVAAEQERARQQRLAAARAEHERLEAERLAAEAAERQRQERNAPVIAKIEAQILFLEDKRQQTYDAHLAKLDHELDQLRSERKGLS